ncbi:MAG: 5'-3' exonuclease, partial [Desulfovibrionales bacterium]
MPLKQRISFPKEPLYLIDGSSFLYRAFYAYPDLKRSDGFPTNAIFILLRILVKLLREEKPKFAGFFLDGKGPSFRQEILEDYKAHRPKMPEPLAKQIPHLIRGVELLGIPLDVTRGVEADDCIASLAQRFKPDRPVVIVGSDKDLHQCLDENVILWDPGQRTEKVLTLEDFQDAQGLEPAQWPDYLALVGDKSDNIPGIPGVGPKTARSLLQRHGNVQGLVDHFDHLTAKEQEKLHSRLDDLLLYRRLTALRLDSCPEAQEDDFLCRPVDESGLVRFLHEFEFRSLLRELRFLREKPPKGEVRHTESMRPKPLAFPLHLG